MLQLSGDENKCVRCHQWLVGVFACSTESCEAKLCADCFKPPQTQKKQCPSCQHEVVFEPLTQVLQTFACASYILGGTAEKVNEHFEQCVVCSTDNARQLKQMCRLLSDQNGKLEVTIGVLKAERLGVQKQNSNLRKQVEQLKIKLQKNKDKSKNAQKNLKALQQQVQQANTDKKKFKRKLEDFIETHLAVEENEASSHPSEEQTEPELQTEPQTPLDDMGRTFEMDEQEWTPANRTAHLLNKRL